MGFDGAGQDLQVCLVKEAVNDNRNSLRSGAKVDHPLLLLAMVIGDTESAQDLFPQQALQFIGSRVSVSPRGDEHKNIPIRNSTGLQFLQEGR